MKSTAKMSSEERRAAITKAVRRVFAEKGFHGTTTRELAQAAGVSEALLFKHFPNKEALYSAMMLACKPEKDQRMFERVKALEPSTSTLVLMVYILASHMLAEQSTEDDERAIHNRLMLHSLLEDGEFARVFLQRVGSHWIGKVEKCLQAAIAAGDAVEGSVRPSLRGWFSHNLTAMTMIQLLPADPIVEFGLSREKLIEQAVWFSLRGMGLKDEAIARYYTPKTLAQVRD
jgi:AcrR family transcriptional regulator